MKYRLLIVDDEPAILSAMKSYFETRGFEVDCTGEKEEAEALLCHVSYACLIADLRLTPENGNEGLDLLRHAREVAPATRVILLTAFGSAPVEECARQRGVDAFLQKPQRLPAIEVVVRRVVGLPA
jgi:DNA-binding NtrC family response regulator